MIMRLELSQTGDAFLNGNYQLYNVLITAHAMTMIFLCALEALFTVYTKYTRIVTISFKLFDRPLSENKIGESSMSKKPVCGKAVIPKENG